MTEKTLGGDPPIRLRLTRSARARRLSLRVSRLSGEVTLTLPPGVTEREGMDFAQSRLSWLRQHLAALTPESAPVIGGHLPVRGQRVEIRAALVRAPRLEAGALLVPPDPGRAAARLTAFLKTEARDDLARACDRHARALGRPFRKITLRDTRSRWGSCTAAGDLMFSWRLIMAPPEILDYVAAHEVAHLAQMNHSPAFWAEVERLYPDWRAARAWLRREGEALFRIRLG